jgi:hypothetical protein
MPDPSDNLDDPREGLGNFWGGMVDPWKGLGALFIIDKSVLNSIKKSEKPLDDEVIGLSYIFKMRFLEIQMAGSICWYQRG